VANTVDLHDAASHGRQRSFCETPTDGALVRHGNTQWADPARTLRSRIVVRNMIQEFKDFINKGDVVVVAVGLVMALYFKAIVDAIIAGIIEPIIAAIFGKSDFYGIGFDLGDSFVSIGLVIQAAIYFVVVAFILFLIIKAYNQWKQDAPEEEAGPTEVELLTQIRDELRTR
jgi:large conductance mechanosensitive channel